MVVGVVRLLIEGKELGFRNNAPAGLAGMALGRGVCWAGYELSVCWCGWSYG